MVKLTVKNTGRKRVCSVYKCTNNETFMIQRGERSSYESLFLCRDCIREIVEGYIDQVGEAEAAAVFGGSLQRLSSYITAKQDEEPDKHEGTAEEEQKPTRKRTKKGGDNA